MGLLPAQLHAQSALQLREDLVGGDGSSRLVVAHHPLCLVDPGGQFSLGHAPLVARLLDGACEGEGHRLDVVGLLRGGDLPVVIGALLLLVGDPFC